MREVKLSKFVKNKKQHENVFIGHSGKSNVLISNTFFLVILISNYKDNNI